MAFLSRVIEWEEGTFVKRSSFLNFFAKSIAALNRKTISLVGFHNQRNYTILLSAYKLIISFALTKAHSFCYSRSGGTHFWWDHAVTAFY